MLFIPDEEMQQYTTYMNAALASGELQDLRRAVEIFPNYGTAWAVLGGRSKDPQESVQAMWRALWLEPCTGRNYFALGEILTRLDESDPIAKQARILGLWKISYQDEVPEYLSKYFEPEIGADAREPETYALVAKHQEALSGESAEAEEVAAKLRPYRLLNELQRDSLDGMKQLTLEAILEHRADCEPLLRNALREWAADEDALDDESAAMVVAILGEISGPDFADELMELILYQDELIFWHAQWAIFRFGQRHPQAIKASFRASSTKSLDMRCAIAEHLFLMQHDESDVDLLQALLDGYENFAGESDAITLLSTVTGGLVARGQSKLANTLARRYGSRQRGIGKELKDALDGYVFTMLEEEFIHTYDLEVVCLGGALMPDWDSDGEVEDEDFDDDELEDAIDLAPPPRPGRNDPCWCGSGKKYKKCHMNADEESDRKRAEAPRRDDSVSLHASMINRLTQAAVEWHKPNDVRRAREMYFGERPGLELDQEEMGGFLEWMIYDFRDKATRRTAVENFLRTRAAKLTPAESELLESLRDARFGLYEVERVVPGSGVDLHDLFAGDRMFVHDITSSHALHRWDCILTRTQYFQGRWIFPGNGLNVPRNILEHLRGFIEDESRRAKQSAADYVRANSHSLHRVVREAFRRNLAGIKVVNNEGEEVTFGSAVYAVSDEAALIAKLESLEELKAEDPDGSGKRRFVWLQPMGKERRLLGNLEIGDGTLKAEAMSRTRLSTLRGLVEFHGSGLVTHRGDQYTSVDDIKGRVMRGEESPAPKPPTEAERAAVAQFLAHHYAGWPDEHLPALGGMTAREAVQDPGGREAVIDLLRMMENGEERKRDSGEPAYDFNIIRRELGLPEE